MHICCHLFICQFLSSGFRNMHCFGPRSAVRYVISQLFEEETRQKWEEWTKYLNCTGLAEDEEESCVSLLQARWSVQFPQKIMKCCVSPSWISRHLLVLSGYCVTVSIVFSCLAAEQRLGRFLAVWQIWESEFDIVHRFLNDVWRYLGHHTVTLPCISGLQIQFLIFFLPFLLLFLLLDNAVERHI